MVIIPFLGIEETVFNIQIQNLIIIAIFAIASYTDHLDGKIARKNNIVTTFGKFADPLADKILVLSCNAYACRNEIFTSLDTNYSFNKGICSIWL